MFSLEFGQVRELPSRSLYDDEDDDCPEVKTRKFESSVEKLQDTKIVYIATSPLAEAFAKIYLCHSDQPAITGIIKAVEDEEEEVGKLLEVSPGVILCSISSNKISPNEVNLAASAILAPFNSTARVFILSSDHKVNLRLDNLIEQESNYATRCLKSNAWSDATNCSLLEQPNIIGGLPAALLTLSDFKDQPALLVCTFVPSSDIDSLAMKGFFSTMKSSCVSKEVAETRLKAYNKLHLPNNLYT